MSFPTIKTAKEISDIFIASLEAELNQSIPLFPRALNRLWAKMLGLVFVVLFQFSEMIALQMFVSTASDKTLTIGGVEFNPLDELGRQIGLERSLGQRSEGTIDINVITQSGTLLSGSQLLDSKTQELYLTIGDVLLDAPVVTATVRSVEYKTVATLYVDQVLSFVSAPPSIEKDAVVSIVTKQGADPEDTETWRKRQLEWWAARPQGGAYADYREWGGEVDGVENIYPFSGGTPAIATSGAGQVDIYVEASETEDGIAPQALLDAVKDNIEKTASTGLADRRPVNTFVNTASIYRKTVSAVVEGLNVPGDEDQAKEDISTALTNYMLSRESFIDGLSLLPRKDQISEAEASGIAGRVAAASGGTINGVTLDLGAPVALLVEGQKAKIGTVSFG